MMIAGYLVPLCFCCGLPRRGCLAALGLPRSLSLFLLARLCCWLLVCCVLVVVASLAIEVMTTLLALRIKYCIYNIYITRNDMDEPRCERGTELNRTELDLIQALIHVLISLESVFICFFVAPKPIFKCFYYLRIVFVLYS